MEDLSSISRRCPKCHTEYPPTIEVCPKDGNQTIEEAQGQSYHPLIGKFVGSYRLKKQIGAGSAGEVFLAEHPTLSKKVAIKILKPRASSDREQVARFLAEAKAVALLEHPNIVAVSDLSVLPDGRAFYVMEYLEGQSLARRLAKQHQLPPAEALALSLDLLSALSAAHRKGIIHRDIKPANLFLVERAGHPTQLKLLDFGVAKLLNASTMTRPVISLPGTVLGTPAYMAPEQYTGGEIKPSTDIYAVGMVLYEMLAGELPMEDSEAGRRRGALREKCPGLPAAMEAVLARALERSSAKRFSSADEMSNALKAIRALLPISDDSMLAATNPRVMLPTPKKIEVAPEPTALLHLPEKLQEPKSIFIPPPGAQSQGVVGSETPTTPIYDVPRPAAPPAPLPRSKNPTEPIEESPQLLAKALAVTAPAPLVAPAAPAPLATEPSLPSASAQATSVASVAPLSRVALAAPSPVEAIQTATTAKNTPVEAKPIAVEAPIEPPKAQPPKTKTNLLWAASLLLGFLVLGYVTLSPKAPPVVAAPLQAQEVEIAVGANPETARITLTADDKIIAQGNGKLFSTVKQGTKLSLEISQKGFQPHRQSFIAKADVVLQIHLTPEPSSPAVVSAPPVVTPVVVEPPKDKPPVSKVTTPKPPTEETKLPKPQETKQPKPTETKPPKPTETKQPAIAPNESLDDDDPPASPKPTETTPPKPTETKPPKPTETKPNEPPKPAPKDSLD